MTSMYPSIDGMNDEQIEFHGTDLDKIDGGGNKIIRAANCQDLIIHNKIDGRGTHKLIGFGFIDVRGKIDGEGDRWFIDCGRLSVTERKDGMGNLFLVNTPCMLHKKAGAGNIVWCGVAPSVESKGLTQMGEVIEDANIASHSEKARGKSEEQGQCEAGSSQRGPDLSNRGYGDQQQGDGKMGVSTGGGDQQPQGHESVGSQQGSGGHQGGMGSQQGLQGQSQGGIGSQQSGISSQHQQQGKSPHVDIAIKVGSQQGKGGEVGGVEQKESLLGPQQHRDSTDNAGQGVGPQNTGQGAGVAVKQL